MNRPRFRPFVFLIVGARMLVVSHRRAWRARRIAARRDRGVA